MSGKITMTVGGVEIPLTSFDLSIGYGEPGSTTLRIAAPFHFGDVVKYDRPIRPTPSVQKYMVVALDEEGGYPSMRAICLFGDYKIIHTTQDDWSLAE